MILVDSSAWIDFDKANGSPAHVGLRRLITRGGMAIAATEPVLMEVLVGARTTGQRDDLRRLVTSFGWLDFDRSVDFEGAEDVYRSCRRAGVTPRGLVDCMIVNVALRHDAEILASDGDFGRMATVVPLRLHDATPRPSGS